MTHTPEYLALRVEYRTAASRVARLNALLPTVEGDEFELVFVELRAAVTAVDLILDRAEALVAIEKSVPHGTQGQQKV